jgi:hypothetical protein
MYLGSLVGYSLGLFANILDVDVTAKDGVP